MHTGNETPTTTGTGQGTAPSSTAPSSTAPSNGKKFYLFLFGILVVFGIGLLTYLQQLESGLTITGLSRDVPWGLYISQFTFLVGIAASAVIVLLPYYLHDYKAFGKIVIFGEFLAIASVIMCMLFIFVDLGQSARVLNVMLHPSPRSMLFWDMIVLTGYLLINIVIAGVTLSAEISGAKPPRWIKPIILFSIPLAVSIHTVTAFLYSGLAARPFWMTAILAPRFLASAFASGPALLILLCLVLKRVAKYDVGDKAIGKLATIACYAMCINIFFVAVESFTVIYSDIPEHVHHFKYLFFGIGEGSALAPWMQASTVIGFTSLLLLLNPRLRSNHVVLTISCLGVITALWIEKGLGMVIAGFVPNVNGEVIEYWPTLPELLITLGIYAVGALVLTLGYKAVLAHRVDQVAKP